MSGFTFPKLSAQDGMVRPSIWLFTHEEIETELRHIERFKTLASLVLHASLRYDSFDENLSLRLHSEFVQEIKTDLSKLSFCLDDVGAGMLELKETNNGGPDFLSFSTHSHSS